ncbi:MAG TPA: PDZ domain-containing protein [Blastocatellia bacterium]|nr:PDZ domain-containing protein [Blastocatellia bacterium]
MLKRSWKVLMLLSVMAVVAGAQTIVPERCQSQDSRQESSLSQLFTSPLLPNTISGSLAALIGQAEPVTFELLQQADPQTLEQGSLVFSLGQGSYLGVYLDEVTAERVKQLNLKEERGAVVTKVMTDSPAAKAGLQENDVVVGFNGRPVESVRELQRLLGDTPPGRTVSLEVTRGGGRQTVSVTLGERSVIGPGFPRGDDQRKLAEELRKQGEAYARIPKTWEFPNYTFAFPPGGMLARGTGRLGVAIETMSEQLASFFGAKEGGLLITDVRANSPAAKAGLKAGDVIVAVDGENVKEGSDLVRALGKKQEGQVTIKVIRDKSERSINVTLEKLERPRTTSQFVRRSIA